MFRTNVFTLDKLYVRYMIRLSLTSFYKRHIVNRTNFRTNIKDRLVESLIKDKQYKPINMDNLPSSNNTNQDKASHTTLSVFNNNHHFAFVYRKTEKLVTAVYMITNFIKDNDLLKSKVRELSLELLSLNLSFVSVSLSERKTLLKEYEACSIEILSLISIAFHSGLISDMNYQVLKREFDVLIDLIENGENKKQREETVVLPEAFFDVHEADQSTQAIKTTQPTSRISPTQKPAQLIKDKNTDYTKPTSAFKKIETKGHTASVRESSVVMDKKNGRQEVIISLLKKKQGLNIKDFSVVISGCSEKTIQRELTDMVGTGVLRKEGERRWSKYFLA